MSLGEAIFRRIGVSKMLVAQEAYLEAADFRGRSRRILRLSVGASVNGDTPTTATIHNLSQTGLLLETPVDLPVGEWIGVDLPVSGVQSAQVVWASEHLFGCRFYEPVTPATVSAALLRAPFDGADATVEAPSVPAGPPTPRPDKMDTGSQILTIAGLTIALWTAIGGIFLLMA
jgi:hypothetical protein